MPNKFDLLLAGGRTGRAGGGKWIGQYESPVLAYANPFYKGWAGGDKCTGQYELQYWHPRALLQMP